MNDIDARAVPTPHGGFYGEFRRIHRSNWERVRKDRIDQMFDCPFEAEVRAWRELKSHMLGLVVGDNTPLARARTEAEKLFKGGRHG